MAEPRPRRGPLYGERFRRFRAAVEEHQVLTVINDWNLNPVDLAPYKVLILANTACLDKAQISAVEQFVSNGGGLIASLDCSIFDEFGNPRSNFGLGTVLGVEHHGTVEASANRGREEVDYNFASSIGPDYWKNVRISLNSSRIPVHFLTEAGCGVM